MSEQTYKGVIVEADLFNEDLALQFGLLAEECSDDDSFLMLSETLIKELLGCKDLKRAAEDIFFNGPVRLSDFKECLLKILANIEQVRLIPMEDRTYEQW